MSLSATHIRFALNIKNEYKVKNINDYLAGTIYPDSRYVTKIDRELTHYDELLDLNFCKNDFKKGWHVHFLCDAVNHEITDHSFRELYQNEYNGCYNEEKWIIFTAIKIIRDIEDFKKININDHLELFDVIKNPNGEKPDDIKKYNDIIKKIYIDKKEMTIDDACEGWLSLGVEKNLVDKIKVSTHKLHKDKRLTKRIYDFYDKIIIEYPKIIKKYNE